MLYEVITDFAERTAGIRRAGSAALDLAYVACGRFDGFWEIGVLPWDIAGGALLVTEAGGLISDLSGGDEYLKTGNLVAGTPKIFAPVITSYSIHYTKLYDFFSPRPRKTTFSGGCPAAGEPGTGALSAGWKDRDPASSPIFRC